MSDAKTIGRIERIYAAADRQAEKSRLKAQLKASVLLPDLSDEGRAYVMARFGDGAEKSNGE
jgi:hypothetical protein